MEHTSKIASPLRSAGLSEAGNPLYKGLGIVFGGSDLYGEHFSPPREWLTDGDPDVKLGTEYFLNALADEVDLETGEFKGALAIPVFWDHGLGSLGPKRLGKAIPLRITAEGIEYLIEVEKKRAQDYQQMIDELQNEGWLGLSSQTLPSFASFNWSTGEIRSWFPAEMTLTVTPAEHRTRNQLEVVFRRYGVKTTMDEQTVIETADAVVDDLLTTLDAQVDEGQEAVVENAALSYVIRTMDALNQRLDAMEAKLAKSASTEAVETLTEQVTTMNTQFVDALRKSFEGLGTILTKAVQTKAADMVRDSSDFEIEAMRTVTSTPAASIARRTLYNLPPTAPGQG